MADRYRPSVKDLTLRTRTTRRWIGTLALTLGGTLVLGGLGANQTLAEEPAEEFLQRLRDVGYYDTAIAYLDRANKIAGLSPDFLSAIPLEKAQTHIAAAVTARSAKERDAWFVSAQDELKEFLKLSSHPRQAEAKLFLGKIQMRRASQLVAGQNVTDEARNSARESYLEAAKTFDGIAVDLRKILEELKGQRIDPEKEPEKVAMRERYRGEYLQAQLSGADSRLMAAKTFPNPATDGKTLLEESLKAFIDLSDKYDNFVPGALAMTYRGQVQVLLDKKADAIDSFQRVLEQADVEPLRAARMQAITGLIKLWTEAKPPQLAEATELGQSFVSSARPDEKRMQELQDLQLALAQAYLLQAEQLKEAKKPAEEKRAISSARQLLNAISKVSGPHEDETKQLLAKLGIEKTETKEPVAAVNVKSLEEALTAARDLLVSSDELKQTANLLKDQEKEGDNAAAIADELKSIDTQLDQNRVAIINVIRRGLEIGSKDKALLNQARQYLSYALFERGLFYEAAVVGRYLSTTSPSDSVGLGGGLIALSALQNALKSASEDETLAITRQIESLGELLTRQWPDDPKAVAAKGIMIRMALEKDRWDDAKKLIDGMPDGDEKANYKRLLGMLTWNRSLMLRQEKKNAEADALLPEAAAVLREGLDGIPGVLSGPEVLQAALVLAKIELRRDDAVAALAVLDHEKYGPLPLVEKLGEPSDGFKSDIYSAELQAVVGVMTSDGSDTAALLTRATDTMGRLQESVKGKEDASTRLVRIYVNMATDIRAQLDSATPEKKTKLIGAFRVFLDSIAKSSQDPATLQWAGQTLMQMGEASMGPGERVAQGQAKELLTSAATTLADLVSKQGKDAAPALKFQLAKAYRLNGEYKKSVDLLHEVLSVNQMMLDAQIEAATAYEYWAGSIQPNYAANAYKSALVGARPDKNGKNVIWGWGRISKLVSGRPELQETFFDARYHIAVCRYLMGKSLKDNKVIDQAQNDITQVAALYPELGGPEKRAQFDLLLKEIQKSLGKKPEGLPPLQAVAG